MATKSYSLRQKLSTAKHTTSSDVSNDLFDSILPHSNKSSTSPLTKAASKSSLMKTSKKKNGKSPTKSPIMYSFSYSPSSGMATSIRKESPVMGKSGAKRKSHPKEKAKLTIFDFTSDDESDSAGKVEKVSKTSQKGRVGKKVVKKVAKKTKDTAAGQSSDGNQISDSEYSSQDSQLQMSTTKPLAKKTKPVTGRKKDDSKSLAQGSQVRMSTAKPKTKLAEKTEPSIGRQKTAKRTEAESCDTESKIAPAVSIKRKSSSTSLKATSPKKPRIEPLTTPSPGRPRVTRSGRLTRSTYRAAALWGEGMEVESASENVQRHEGGTDVEDPLCMETTRSICVSKEGEGSGLERDGGQEKSREKEEPSQSGEDLQESRGKGGIVSGFDVLDSDKLSERSPIDLSHNGPEHSSTSLLQAPLEQADKLVSDASKSVTDASISTTMETKLKREQNEGETTVSEQLVEQMKHSPSPEPLPSSSRSDAEEQGSSKDPLTVVVEDYEESQSGMRGGEESMMVDLSLSEPVDEPANRRQFERHLAVPSLKKSSSGTACSSKSFPGIDVPSLTRTSSWPRCSGNGKGSNGGKKTGVRCNRQEKELITVVRNVREAHECLEMGESQQFFDEMDYLLDSIAPEQPINVRCLGTCNLATHCLDTEFSRQIRAHGFTDKIINQLQDSMEHPGLCLSTATLFYVMTRDKFNSEWNKTGVELLVRMLAPSDSPLEADLTGKAAREFLRTKTKARSVLEKTMENRIPRAPSPKEEEKEEEEKGEGEEGRLRKKPCTGEQYFRVDVENISVRELSREALLALTSPQHNPHWLREELRIAGGLDHLANMVISGCQVMEGCDHESESGEGDDGDEGVERRVRVMERVLKTLENVTLMNKDNQSYLVVFDGSLLVSKLTRLITVCHELTKEESIRHTAVDCLLAVMKLLLNLTHDSELGSHRVGEQRGAMEAMLNTIFQLPDLLPEEHHFDIIVLGLGLLINMSEHSAQNRAQLQSTRIDDHLSSQETAEEREEDEDIRVMQADVMGCHGTRSSLKALIRLFLKHHAKADQATIEVPTPQRLSQISSSTLSSPRKTSSQVQRDLTPSFTAGGRGHGLSKTHRSPSKSRSSRKAAGAQDNDGMGWLPEDPTSQEDKAAGETESEEEEEFESLPTDPLVFSREEFDTALNQAGQHMEDSIVASYTALLLGILARHNQDSVDAIRREMPSKSFSEMIAVLRKFVSFMNIAGTSGTGLDSIRHIIKYLEAL